MTHYELGTAAASEAVIRDLYVNLRSELFKWSAVTFQTPQPRMGYIGQHLTSVVTGYPGGRSGARGHDLVLPDGSYAEIKTCYRVDQLGSCGHCRQVVASVETVCQRCGSTEIIRKDDSKWLISPKHDGDMRRLFDPVAYYLVLFDFEDLADPTVINARIYAVDPRHVGFSHCLVDYYFNIKAKSVSGAPFNLWPNSLKFQLMEPCLIYHAQIRSDNTISTLIFPGEIGDPHTVEVDPLDHHARATGFTAHMIEALARTFDVPAAVHMPRRQALVELQRVRERDSWPNGILVDTMVEAMYSGGIAHLREWLPRARA